MAHTEDLLSRRLLNLQDCAEILGISDQTVKRYLQQGKITGIKINGKRWRVRPEDLEAFIERCKTVNE